MTREPGEIDVDALIQQLRARAADPGHAQAMPVQ
jgi:hypothetical protein